MRAAIDCVVSILHNNKQLLFTTLRATFDFSQITPEKFDPKGNVLNVVINIKDTQHALIEGDPENADAKSRQMQILRDNKQSRPINLVNYIVNLMRDPRKNNDYIKFFRAICAYKGRAVQVNQEILYKIFENEFFRNMAFIHTKIQRRRDVVLDTEFSDEMWIKFSVKDQNWIKIEDCKP
jgi:hypothetical protein